MTTTVPQHQFHGPFYCETGHPWMGMAEPVNTITNAFIIIAAYLAYRYVKRSGVKMTFDLGLLIFLLAMTGIGSFLWHGLRTQWALTLDWMPGVAFLLVFTTLWFRQLFGWAVGIVGTLLMFGALIGSFVAARFLFPGLEDLPSSLRPVPGFLAITLFAIGLIAATFRKFGSNAGRHGIAILVCALTAGFARSIDLLVCEYVPFGSHFLWHLFLSSAACLGVLLMVRIKKVRIAKLAPAQ